MFIIIINYVLIPFTVLSLNYFYIFLIILPLVQEKTDKLIAMMTGGTTSSNQFFQLGIQPQVKI